MWDLSPSTKDQTHVPALEAQRLKPLNLQGSPYLFLLEYMSHLRLKSSGPSPHTYLNPYCGLQGHVWSALASSPTLASCYSLLTHHVPSNQSYYSKVTPSSSLSQGLSIAFHSIWKVLPRALCMFPFFFLILIPQFSDYASRRSSLTIISRVGPDGSSLL